MTKKYYCPACGYTSDEPIEICPRCGAKMKVRENNDDKAWAAEHIVGVAKDVDPEIIQGLRDNFNGECSEVGMYLAMARVAHREGYPEIGLYWEKQLTKKQSTLLSLQSFSAKFFPIQQRKTLK